MRQSTKQALSETFKILLEARTIDKITVKDIVTKCGVNRQTFYYHFRDIYELMEWTLENDIREYLSDISDFSEDSLVIEWKKSIYHLYQFLYSRKKQILHAYDPVNKTYYENFLLKFITPIIDYRISLCTSASSVPKEKRVFVTKAYTWICLELILEWLEHGMPNEHKIQLDDYLTLVDGSLDTALERFIQR